MRPTVALSLLVCLANCQQHSDVVKPGCPEDTLPKQTRHERWCETRTGLREGPAETFHDNGRRRTAGVYRNNKKTGKWKLWRETGVLLEELDWADGKLLVVRPNSAPCPAGAQLHGAAPPKGVALWCQKRKVGTDTWVNHGPFMSWHTDGEPQAEGSYFDNEPDGEFTMWYPDGSPKVRSRYEKGKEDGLTLSWHDNGRLFIRAVYAQGKEEGLWVSWWEEGTKSAEGTFHAGLEQSAWTFWHPNGKMSAQGNYNAGKKKGWWHTWAADGNAEPMELYDDGVRVGTGIEDPPTHSE
jgi:antitoxin component YwqK of YwqJK toxin-antitoxin module